MAEKDMKHLKTGCQGQHTFLPITWSLTSTKRTAHEFMCSSCLMIVTRTDIDQANEQIDNCCPTVGAGRQMDDNDYVEIKILRDE